jgi:hypothetical protein
MRTRNLVLACSFGFALLSCPAAAIAQQDEGEPTELIRQVLLEADGVDGVFSADGAGNAKHAQSGLVCPAYVQTAFLFQIMSFDSPRGKGTDVGCDYGRRMEPGSSKAAAKHTVFAVKAPEGMTLDEAFAQYQDEMHQTVPANARSGGESLHLEDRPPGFPDFRSEELFYTSGGRDMQTEVLVTIINGWIIEVRSTRTSQYAMKAPEEGPDQIIGTTLFFDAIASLGGPDYNPEYEIVPADPSANQKTPVSPDSPI